MNITRRELMRTAALTPGVALANTGEPMPKGKADACIFLWLGGGAAHIDTFDPKRRGDGKKVAGSYYDSIPTAVRDVKLTEHLAGTAKVR